MLGMAMMRHGLAQVSGFGAFDPVFTPFRPDGSLNLDVIPGYARLTSDMGTDTIILGGSTGEWPSMTSEERLQTLISWRAAVDQLPTRSDPALRPRPRILFHVGDVAVHRAMALARDAEKHGADAILIVAPCIMRPESNEMLVKVFGQIAAQAPNTPSWYYYYPSLYNVDFPVTPFLELAVKTSAIPTLEGVKFISSDAEDLANATALYQHKFKLVSTHLLAGMQGGQAGAIVYTAAGPLVNKARAALAVGNLTGAKYYDSRVSALNHIFKKHGGTKQGARASVNVFAPGLDLGPPRLPLAGPTSEQLSGFKQDLIDGGFLSAREMEASNPQLTVV